MTTLLKAHLRKTTDPLDMFEILLHEYYPTILKATGAQFIDAILADQDTRAQLRGFSKETLEAFKKLQKASEESLTRFKDFDKDEMEGEFPEFMHRDILMGEPDVMVSGKPKKRGKKRTQRRTGEEEVRMDTYLEDYEPTEEEKEQGYKAGKLHGGKRVKGKTIGASTIKDPKIPKPTKRKWLSQLKRKETKKEFQARLKRWERNKAKTLEPRGEFRRGETGYEKPYRFNNLIKFKNLLEAEKNWDGSKWGELTKIINGLGALITKEEERLAGAKKKKTGQFEGEGQASKEKVIEADANLKRDLKILKTLQTRLKSVNIFDLEGQLAFDKSVEDPILELLPNPKAINDLEKAILPSYYFKPLNLKKMSLDEKDSLNKIIREAFNKEIDKDFARISKPTKNDPFPLESFKEGGKDSKVAYREERAKDFKHFKKQWLQDTRSLYTDSENVILMDNKDKAVNDLKKEVHELLTKEMPYREMTGEKVKKSLFEAILYAREQKTGVIIERIKADRDILGKEFNALKRALNEGTLRDLLELSRVDFKIGPTKVEINMDEWGTLKDDVKTYLNNEFKEVRITPTDSAPIGGEVMVKEAKVTFLEPTDGFDKNDFTTNFENTFSDRVNIKGAIKLGKTKTREQIRDERGNEE